MKPAHSMETSPDKFLSECSSYPVFRKPLRAGSRKPLNLYGGEWAVLAFRNQMILDAAKENQDALDEICGRVGRKFADRVKLSGSREISILP